MASKQTTKIPSADDIEAAAQAELAAGGPETTETKGAPRRTIDLGAVIANVANAVDTTELAKIVNAMVGKLEGPELGAFGAAVNAREAYFASLPEESTIRFRYRLKNGCAPMLAGQRSMFMQAGTIVRWTAATAKSCEAQGAILEKVDEAPAAGRPQFHT